MEYLGIKLDLSRDELFSEQGKVLLSRYYDKDKAGIQKALARAANCFSFGDKELAQFIYDAASKHWFMFSSPILSNAVAGEWVEGKWTGPAPKAMPIACFLGYVGDSIDSQIKATSELSRLSVMGGGTALHLGIRAISDKAPGPIPYIQTIDGVMGYYKQGTTRKGATAVYMDIDHPDIIEFINMRVPSGGDSARKINNRSSVHIAVNITDKFAQAVKEDLPWNLVCPHTADVKEVVKARDLWHRILDVRAFTGGPYLYFIDVANRDLPQTQKDLGLRNNGSNLCNEITLATGEDRTAVCCLSSLNLEKYDEWKDEKLVANLVRFLDNVLEWFIQYAPKELERAVYSAKRERAIGIGAMGFHGYLMKNLIPWESGGFNSATSINHQIFSKIHKEGIEASLALGKERGEAPDMKGTGRRNSHVFAIAPNTNSSVLCNTTASIEPIASNAFPQKGRAGITLFKNQYLEDAIDWTTAPVSKEEFWADVISHKGSVQHLDWIPEDIRKVFKTAYEIDNHWVIQLAEDRADYVCQNQSLNVFFLPGSEKSYINSVHLKAMLGGKVKGMYYYRTGSEASADTIKKIERRPLSDWSQESEVCLSCEG